MLYGVMAVIKEGTIHTYVRTYIRAIVNISKYLSVMQNLQGGNVVLLESVK